MIFFTLLGFTLYRSSRYVDPSDYGYWVTLQDSMFNIYVLFTTSNFPDIIFPYYKINNLTFFYFVIFLAIGIWMIMNLVVAVFYNEYRNQIERKIKKYDKTREVFIK